jgi:hypothetical protein
VHSFLQNNIETNTVVSRVDEQDTMISRQNAQALFGIVHLCINPNHNPHLIVSSAWIFPNTCLPTFDDMTHPICCLQEQTPLLELSSMYGLGNMSPNSLGEDSVYIKKEEE